MRILTKYIISARSLIFVLFGVVLNLHQAYADCRDTILIHHVNAYLRTLNKVAIEFTQFSEGKEYDGVLLIEKPNNFRVNYESSYPLLIVGGKNYLSIYDFELEELSRISAKENPFSFLLNDNINRMTMHDFKMNQCVRNNNFMKIELQHNDTEKEIELVFDNNPMKITNIKIRENNTEYSNKFFHRQINEDNSVKTEDIKSWDIDIKIRKINFLTYIPNEFFIIKNPSISGGERKITNEEIIKKVK